MQGLQARNTTPYSPSPRARAHSNHASDERSCAEDNTQFCRVACGPPERAEVAILCLALVFLAIREGTAGVFSVADTTAFTGTRKVDDLALASFEEAVANDGLGVEDVGRVGVKPVVT